MRCALVSVLLALLGVAGQEGRRVAKDYPRDGVYWARTWHEALKEAANRNVPLLIAFHQDGSEECDKMAALYRDRRFIEHSRTWVGIVAQAGTSHDPDVEIDGKKVARCERYFQVTCQEHGALHAQLKPLFKVDSAPPLRIYFDAAKFKELGRDTGAPKMADWIKTMDKFQGLFVGEKISADDWRKSAVLMAEGDTAFKMKEWQKAIKAYRSVAKIGGNLAHVGQAALNKVNLEGEHLHTKAFESQPKDLKGEFTATKKTLREIMEKFKTLPVAQKAHQYLVDLERHGH